MQRQERFGRPGKGRAEPAISIGRFARIFSAVGPSGEAKTGLHQAKANSWRLMMVLIIMAATVFAGQAHAESRHPELSLEIVPENIATCPGRDASVTAVARNRGDVGLNDVRLSWQSPASIRLAIADPAGLSESTLKSASDIAWPLTVRVDPDVNWPEFVVFRVDYQVNGVPGIATRAIETTRRALPALAEVVRAESWSHPETLTESDFGQVVLRFTNVSALPIVVQSLVANAPEDLTIAGGANWAPKTISSGSTDVFTFAVASGPSTRPGPQRIAFQAVLEQSASGCTSQGAFVAHHTLNMAVRGADTILTAAGVPSLLLLPGFLMVTMVGLLWRMGLRLGSRPEAPAFPLRVNEPDFWLIAIGLSLALTTTTTVAGFDLGHSYGLRDVQSLWSRSLVSSGAAWLVIIIIERGFRLLWTRKVGWSTNDDPVAVLRKLGLRGRAPSLFRVRVKLGEEETNMLLLAEGREHAWVCGTIGYRIRPESGTQTRSKLDEAMRRGRARPLARLLAEAERTQAIEGLHWTMDATPREVRRDQVLQRLDGTPILREEGVAVL